VYVVGYVDEVGGKLLPFILRLNKVHPRHLLPLLEHLVVILELAVFYIEI